ncbi:unnamed protein product [Schistosoma margrebowiei]|uniref:Uncharacterized protein n=1 Tax=Schistosoma margrebowiei TaxID=48269 RepID=A0A183M087_9TREM|nr:unnamed protein product [Schistosoma margrebowiei]
MSHHDYSAPKQKENEDISVDDNDEDPVVSMIARTGCSNEHYAILDCMNKKKDWRHCQEFVKNFKDYAILDYLFSKNWISHNEIELIGLEKTAQNKSRKILELIRLRPSGAFDDFLMALDSEGSFLAAEIRKHIAPSPSRKKEHSLSDLRELLLEGAVPDKPSRYINRPDLVSALSNKLRALADHFRVDKIPADKLAEIDIAPRFQDCSKVMGNLNPPPTNAWLLIHGSPGSGKSVLAASVLRQEPTLLADCFPGATNRGTIGHQEIRHINEAVIFRSNRGGNCVEVSRLTFIEHNQANAVGFPNGGAIWTVVTAVKHKLSSLIRTNVVLLPDVINLSGK